MTAPGGPGQDDRPVSSWSPPDGVCGGELKIIAAILEAPVIERILTHLGADAARGLSPASPAA